MAAPKRPTHEVTHKNFFYTIDLDDDNGKKYQRVPKGTHITLDEKEGERLVKRGVVASLADRKVVDATGTGDEKKD